MLITHNFHRREGKQLMPRFQFGLKTLLWLMVLLACALVGFTAGQRYEHEQLTRGWTELHASTRSRSNAMDRIEARFKTRLRQVDEQASQQREADRAMSLT